MTPQIEDFARQINADFDKLAHCRKSAGITAALRDASATAFAAVAFVEQVAGRQEALILIGELLDA